MPWDYQNPYLFGANPQTFAAQPQQGPAIPPYTEQELPGKLQELGQTALSGLGYVGGVLDKTFGGRAIRGLLGGNPRELLSIIPGSDVFNLTKESDIVRGRDLLDPLLGKSTPGFDLGDVAGFGLDVALDPATYLSFGGKALTQAGVDALKQGTLKSTLAERIAAKQGGLVGVGLPWQHPSAVFGTGAGAERFAQKLGTAYDKALYSYPGRALSAAFSPVISEAGGGLSETFQRAARANAPLRRQLQNEYMDRLMGIMEPLHVQGVDVGPRSSYVRDLLEGQTPGIMNPALGPAIPIHPQINTAVQDIRTLLDEMQPKMQALGMKAPSIQNYSPREALAVGVPTKGYGTGRETFRPFDPHHASLIQREDAIRDMPTNLVNAMSVDPAVSGPGHTLALTPGAFKWDTEGAHIRQNYFPHFNAPEEAEYANFVANYGLAGPPGPLAGGNTSVYDRWKYLEGEVDRSKQAAAWANSLDPQRAASNLPVFGRDLFQDLETRIGRQARGESRATTLLNTVAKAAEDAQAAGGAGPGGVRIMKALQEAGLQKPVWSVPYLQRQMASSPTQAALRAMEIPADVAADISKSGQVWTQPEALKPILGAMDNFTNLFKAFNTAIWPAKHVRDLTQGVFANLAHGNMGIGDMLKAYRDSHALVRQGGAILQDAHLIPDLAHLSPEEATRALQKESYVRKIAGPEKLTRDAPFTPGAQHAAQEKFVFPGSEAQPSLAEIAKGSVPTSWQDVKDIAKVRGVGDIAADVSKPVAAGRQLERYTDDLNRMAGYLSLRRQGYLPDAAQAAIEKTHYTYELSQFEKSFMRRIMPFYSWTRHNLPAQAELLATKPGGLTGQAVRFAGDLHAKTGFVPPQIGEGVGVPIGGEDNGTQRFLSHLGLPFEDAFADIGVGRGPTGNVMRTAENLLGQTSPLIKAPIELATGKQLYSGRRLQDLYGPTGNVLIDQAIMNSPLARTYTSLRTLADERKGIPEKLINLVSPARITDVDMNKAREIASRDASEALLSGVPGVKHFEEMYVPRENVPLLSPRELELVRIHKTLEMLAQKRAKAAQAAGG